MIHLDFETASFLDLGEVGLDCYLTHPSTHILCLAYAFDGGDVKVWESHVHFPDDLAKGLEDESQYVVGWNVAFERNVFKWLLGIDLPIRRFRDVMVKARFLSLPGSLQECGESLGMSPDKTKIRDGERLLRLFGFPVVPKVKETLFGTEEPYFRNSESHPEDWAKLLEYCKQDVVAERALLERMKNFPLTQQEWEAWFLSEEINERGVMTDRTLVDGAAHVASVTKGELLEQLARITQLENPNSNPQMMKWLQAQGYTFHSMGKSFVARALAGECSLTDAGKQVLTIRQQAAKTGAVKLQQIQKQVSSDNRLRYQYNFMGASRTGRWSSGSGD